jgi:hypothetical protein
MNKGSEVGGGETMVRKAPEDSCLLCLLFSGDRLLWAKQGHWVGASGTLCELFCLFTLLCMLGLIPSAW